MTTGSSTGPLEFWGGVECTLNRVGDQFFDQLESSGHKDRLTDLDLIAGLGIRTLRYPALWETAVGGGDTRDHCLTHRHSSYDWSWADHRLPRLRELNISPIVGFLHHGSGPAPYDLLNPKLPKGLAAYAAAFAERFPWVEAYTPVNEPLTTARFSALYGHWYPHRRDNAAFAKACLNQYRGTVLAMQAIRHIRPDAKLVQTEDLGKTFSSPSLAYQAEFENARRWLTFDLLTGKVDCHHPIGEYLLAAGISEAELAWFQDNVCPPDICGLNYYVTSERYLDRCHQRHPAETRGGNGRHRYADVAAVRVRPQGLAGINCLLVEAWERFGLPLAVTEVHLHCGREDQMRWLMDIWRDVQAARAKGVDVRAITSWSLFGAFDWDSLVTQQRGHYESGAFDIRGPAPRPTAVAGLIQELTSGREPAHPVLAQPGWWRRGIRFTHGGRRRSRDEEKCGFQGSPLLITGATGKLGRAFSRICHSRGILFRLVSREEMDIADSSSVAAALENLQPWAVINAAGYARVNEAERNAERCRRENLAGPLTLAKACQNAKLPLLTFSSHLVFDGQQRTPYAESDRVNPLGVYARTKAECEQRVLDAHPEAMVVRTSAFFSPWDDCNFVTLCRRVLQSQQPYTISEGVVSPTYLPDLVHACLDLTIDKASGLWHLAGAGEISWAELVEEVAQRAGLGRQKIDLRISSAANTAHRPVYSALRSERGFRLPSWRDALDRYFLEAPAVLNFVET